MFQKENTYRYPGAQPFNARQKHIFFGREKDVEAVLELISLEQIVVMYAKSGLGKSSLINAGVVPSLAKSSDTTIFPIRLGPYSERFAGRTPIETIRIFLESKNPTLGTFFDKLDYADQSLWFLLKRLQIHQVIHQDVLLIFDQFEEIFTYPEEVIHEFKSQIGELLHMDIPHRFREIIETQFEGEPQAILTDEEMEQLHQPLEVKILCAIRSDRISLLNNLSDTIPEIFRCHFELKALDVEQAEEAILNPAFKQDKQFISPAFDYSDAAIEELLAHLTNQHQDRIESFQLQIICQSLEQKIIDQKKTSIEVEDLQDLAFIYENYYEQQINRVGSTEEVLTARRLIEDGLIFQEEERRVSLYEGQIYSTFGFTPELLSKLVNVHLIRAEPSLKGGFTYELSHDTLVPPILKAKRKRLAKEKKKTAELERLQREKELSILRAETDREKRKKRRARMIALATSFLAVIAILSTIYAFRQSQLAEKAQLTALTEKDKVEGLNQTLQIRLFEIGTANYNNQLARGRQLRSEGDFPAALTTFREALAAVAGYEPPIDSAGQTAQSEISATEELAAQTGAYTRLLQEGEALVKQGINSYRIALQRFREAKKLAIDDDHLLGVENRITWINNEIQKEFNRLKNLGRTYFQDQQIASACQTWRKALQLKPNDQEIQKNLTDHCN